MAININHSNNTLYSNSGTFIFGTGIVPNIENAVYSNSFSGKYYGDGSSLNGLATGDFITKPNDFVYQENNFSFILGENNSNSGNYNFIKGYYNNISGCSNAIFGSSNTIFDLANSNVVISTNSQISGYACNNAIIGGVGHRICPNVFASAIIGGANIVASTSFTTYAQNFCAEGGKYYGDGSSLTGITGLGGVSVPTQTNVLLTGSTGFFHKSKNVGIIASNCISPQNYGGIDFGYLYLNKDNGNEVETENLFAISPTTYCVGTFSAMLIGNGWADGAATTTSMRIDGAYGNGTILNQAKTFYYRTHDSTDAEVRIEADAIRVFVTGVTGTMVWSSKIDILDMLGYD